MKRLSFLVLVAAGALISFTRCTKKDLTISKQGIIGTWIMTSHVYSPSIDYDGDGDKESEVFGYYPVCSADDVFVFSADGTGEFNEGNTKCDQRDEQVINYFDWDFDEETRILMIDDYDNPIGLRVLQADGKTLKVSLTKETEGRTYTETQIFKKLQ